MNTHIAIAEALDGKVIDWMKHVHGRAVPRAPTRRSSRLMLLRIQVRIPTAR
jgi:hypothetical protein